MALPSSEITSLGSVASLVMRALSAHGCDPAPLFARAGIEMASVSDPNTRVPTTRMMKLWALSLAATGNPCFGLFTARQFQPAVLHGLGFAWLASDTLHDALKRLARYSRLINALVDIRVEDSESSVDLLIQVPTDFPNFTHVPTDAGMAIFLRMCQMTLGADIQPTRVRLQRPAPPCESDFVAMFGPHIEYASPELRLCFDRALADQSLETANPELARINDQTVMDYLARFDRASIAMRVRSQIIEQLPDGMPRQENIAGTLHVSLRSLQRRLKEEETSFKDLLEDTRQALALQYLKETHRSIGEITYLLGFSEPSNFTRAFKRWTGKSPGEFRDNA